MLLIMMMKIMSVVLYGCETCYVPVKEVLKLRVLDYRLLGKIFVHKKEKVSRKWRKLHIEKLHKFYSTPDIY